MVGFTFKQGFVPLILNRTKKQTIRRPRKVMPRSGQDASLFSGDRYHPVRIGDADILAVRDVRLDFKREVITLDNVLELSADEELIAFAIRDGFSVDHTELLRQSSLDPWTYMTRWWRMTHPDQPVFPGMLVDWGDTFRPHQAAPQPQEAA